ncbi:nuclear transport factor 2 family protein [Nocardia sp. NPDC101769]|uniref:nuclear transport factor 2 family protein n=1 Tax=Nocardia sp. NPDC101769 TaxID=3364333 RepID=UPI0037FD3A9B
MAAVDPTRQSSTPDTFPTRIDSPEQWVEVFTEAFGAGAYESVARLHRLTHPNYQAVQPHTPVAIGPAGLLDLFSRVYALMPDFRGEVIAANVFDGGVHIEVRLSGTLGGKPVTWDACDRFWFEDGLVRGRVTYLDPTQLIGAVVLRPRAWLRWWRSGLGLPRRSIDQRLIPGHSTGV